jgi:hypothetical protein
MIPLSEKKFRAEHDEFLRTRDTGVERVALQKQSAA